MLFLLVSPLFGSQQTITFNTLSDIESQAITFIKDSDGFIWIGTYVDGLHRFDGKSLKHFVKASDLITSNNIPAIVEDRDHHLWFTAAGGGLTRYDKETNKVEHFSQNPDDPNSIASNNIRAVLAGSRNRIWIGTEKGLDLLNENRTGFTYLPLASSESTTQIELLVMSLLVPYS